MTVSRWERGTVIVPKPMAKLIKLVTQSKLHPETRR